eukprot:sb/3466340/
MINLKYFIHNYLRIDRNGEMLAPKLSNRLAYATGPSLRCGAAVQKRGLQRIPIKSQKKPKNFIKIRILEFRILTFWFFKFVFAPKPLGMRCNPLMRATPPAADSQLFALEAEYKEGDLTKQGYDKRRSRIIANYQAILDQETRQTKAHFLIQPTEEEDKVVEVRSASLHPLSAGSVLSVSPVIQFLRWNALQSPHARDPACSVCQLNPSQLFALEAEYKEGDLTKQGYDKRRSRIIANYQAILDQETRQTKAHFLIQPTEEEDKVVEVRSASLHPLSAGSVLSVSPVIQLLPFYRTDNILRYCPFSTTYLSPRVPFLSHTVSNASILHLSSSSSPSFFLASPLY